MRKNRKMTAVDLSTAVGDRARQWLRQRYERDAAKRIARDFNVGQRTAETWLAGAKPADRHLWAMVARWGRPFLDWISMPALTPEEEASLDERLERLEADLRNLLADLVAAERPQRVAPMGPASSAGRMAPRPGESGTDAASRTDGEGR